MLRLVVCLCAHMPLFVWHPNYTSLTLIRGTRYELATGPGVGLARMLTSQYVLVYPRVRQIMDLAFLSFRISSILSKGFQGDTFKNTRSPTSYSLSFRVKSTYFLCPSWSTTSGPLIRSIISLVLWTTAGPSILRSTTSS